jgi:hypothetical protein
MDRLMTESEIQKIISGIVRLETLVNGLSDRIASLERRLFGNGQPGELAVVNKRLSHLEQFKYSLIGAAAVLGALGASVVEIVRWIITGRR